MHSSIEGGGLRQQLVHPQKIEDVDHLKEVPNSSWEMISQELIDGSIEQRSKQRSSSVVRCRRGYTENCFS